VRRRGDAGSFLFLVSHRDDDVDLAVSGYDLVTDRQAEGRLVLLAGGVAVVRETDGGGGRA
jgi:beta-galactosidase